MTLNELREIPEKTKEGLFAIFSELDHIFGKCSQENTHLREVGYMITRRKPVDPMTVGAVLGAYYVASSSVIDEWHNYLDPVLHALEGS